MSTNAGQNGSEHTDAAEIRESLRADIKRRIAHAEHRAYECNWMTAWTEAARYEGEARALRALLSDHDKEANGDSLEA